MSNKLRYASAFAVAVTFLTTLFSAEGSGAFAQSLEAPAAIESPAVPALSQRTADATATLAAPAPARAAPIAQAAAEDADDTDAAAAAQPAPSQELSRELQCLAGAIYFEAKGESLPGQLAVGRVIVNRSKSGRFPASYCGVVFQKSQFSFVRGRSMPRIDKKSRAWTNAVKMAHAADKGSKSPAEGALFFHAARVSPGWKLTRIARIDNHIFYR